jgi:hypothetical protein
VQAEIGQNRSVFPCRSNLPRKLDINGTTEPPRLLARCAPKAGHGLAGRRSPPRQPRTFSPRCDRPPACRRSLGAKSKGGTKLAGSPLRTIGVTRRTGCTACARTAHPIVSFEKTGQRTLETFNSHAGRTDCNTSVLDDGASECSSWTGA